MGLCNARRNVKETCVTLYLRISDVRATGFILTLLTSFNYYIQKIC